MTPTRSARLCAAALAAALSVGPLAGCQQPDPNSPAAHIAKLGNESAKEVADAVRELRKLKAKEAVDPLVPLLKHADSQVREEAAFALMDIGDAKAVQPLIDAVDLASTAKGIGRANAKIAEALGTLGDKKAVPALLKMAEAKDPYVKLAAVTSLGKLNDPASVPTLVKLVDDEKTEPLVTKRAIIALGDMKAQGSLNALAKALVMERQGISFFGESSYAMFQIGAPAVPVLEGLLNGTDKDYVAWAESKKRDPAGYVSKAAVVLADLGEASAVPSLVKLMKWEHPAGNDVFAMLVHGSAADALGRLRAKEGVAVLAKELEIPEANIREKYAVALAWIGDTSVLPKLEAASKKGSWTARQSAITGIALLGNGKNRGAIDAQLKAETPDAAVKHCVDETQSETEPMEMTKARCEKERENRPKFLNDELARLLVADECKDEAACWTKKLQDPNVKIRERAALELGRQGDPAAVPALAEAAKDKELPARRAAFIALDWMTKNPAAKDALVKVRPALAKQFEDEKDKAHTIVVNEDLKRVVWKLQQL